MSKYTEDIITNVLGVFGITLSVQDISQVLNIVLLVVSIVNILIVLGLRIYNLIKKKQYKDIPVVIEDSCTEINEVVKDYENH